MGKVIAVCISEKKGTVKTDVGSCRIIRDHGLEGDAHAGSERQVSLLSYEAFEEFRKNIGRDKNFYKIRSWDWKQMIE